MKFKKMLFICLSVVMSIIPNSFALANVKTPTTILSSVFPTSSLTRAEYEDWFFENQDENAIEKYNSLTDEQKDKLVSYLSDPYLLIDTLEANITPNSSRVFNNGDLIVSVEEVIENLSEETIKAATQTVKATYVRTTSIFGLKVFETTAWIQYTHNGSEIISIDGSNIFTSVNWYVIFKAVYSGKTTWKTTMTAYASSDIVWEVSIEDYGVTTGSNYIRVSGNTSNTAGGYYE